MLRLLVLYSSFFFFLCVRVVFCMIFFAFFFSFRYSSPLSSLPLFFFLLFFLTVKRSCHFAVAYVLLLFFLLSYRRTGFVAIYFLRNSCFSTYFHFQIVWHFLDKRDVISSIKCLG